MKRKSKIIAMGLCFVLTFALIGVNTKSGADAAGKNLAGDMMRPDGNYHYQVTNAGNHNTIYSFFEAAMEGSELETIPATEFDGNQYFEGYKKVKIGNTISMVGGGSSGKALLPVDSPAEDVVSSEGHDYSEYISLRESEDVDDVNESQRIEKLPWISTFSQGNEKMMIKFKNLDTWLEFDNLVFDTDTEKVTITSDKEYKLIDKTLVKNGSLTCVMEDPEDMDDLMDRFADDDIPYPLTYTITKPTTLSVDDAALKKNSSTIYAGGTKDTTSKAELNIPEALKPHVKSTSYASSNSKVATVSNGLIKAKKKGTANVNVTLTLTNNTSKTFTHKVTVKNASISFAKKTVSVKKKKSVTVKAKLKGHNPAKIKWSTSNKKVAKITKKAKSGKVTIKGMKKGKATITAKIKVGKKTVKKTFTVKVK